MYQRLCLIRASLKSSSPTFFFQVLIILSKVSFPHCLPLSPPLSLSLRQTWWCILLCYPLLAADSLLSCRKPSGTHGIVSCSRPSSCLLPTLTGGWRSQMVACSVRLPPSAASHSCHPKLNVSHTNTTVWDMCEEWNHMQQIRSTVFAQNLILVLIGVIYQQWLRKRERAENVGLTSINKHHRPAAFVKQCAVWFEAAHMCGVFTYVS